jgi:uncharacterized membrane protein YdjX (TVP38/TMEM64 family)
MFQSAKKTLLQIGPRKLLKGFLTLFAIIAIGYGANHLDFEGWARWINFGNSPNTLWYQGKGGYFVVGVLFTAIGGPRQVMAFFAAFFFGIWPGFLLSMAAVTTSCLIGTLVARVFTKPITAFIRGKVDVAIGFWRKNPFSTTIILRLLPVGSNLVTNLAAGATGIPLLPFVAGSAIGYVPQMAIFSLMGKGVDVGANGQIALGVALFVAMTIFGMWIYARYRRRIRARGKMSDTENPADGADQVSSRT